VVLHLGNKKIYASLACLLIYSSAS